MVEKTKWIDGHLGPLIARILPTVPASPPDDPRSILIVRLWTLGESLLTLPMIELLHERYPKSIIHVLVTARSKNVFERVPFVNAIVMWGPHCLSRLHSYDLVIDTEPYLQISALSSWYMGKYRIGFDTAGRGHLYHHAVHFDDTLHEVVLFAKMLSVLGIRKKPSALVPLTYSKQEAKEVGSLLGKCKRPLLGICATTAESAAHLRKWPYFAHLAKEFIAKTGGTVVFTGAAADKEYVRSLISEGCIDLSSKTTFGQLVALVSTCDAFVSIDTGPMHLAAAQGTPTVGLFGPNLPERFAPLGKKNIALYHEVACSPCINVHFGEVDKYSCRNNVCMQGITVKQVMDAVQMIMEEKLK